MNRPARLYHLLRELGPRWLWFRVRYAWRRRSGALERRTPTGSWPVRPTSSGRQDRWFKPLAEIGPGAVAQAEAVCTGTFRLFGRHEVVTGTWPTWSANPRTGQAVLMDCHWSRLGDFAFGDIKGIWELSRFPWAFALGRAFARTHDERYAERFWQLFEHWLEHNPPNRGPNWMCGQEATFRLMAVIWTAEVIRGAASTTAARLGRLDGLVAVTGGRIAGNLDYALSQSNNHGVSECVGLVTAAAWCAGLPEATEWRQRALGALRTQLDDLVYADGGFSQHSAVYHRVLLHDVCWLVIVLQRSGAEVPDWLWAAGRRALGFIAALMDPETGRVPLYGPNDGANILLLADGDHLDFRSAVQAAAAVLHGVLPLAPGPWDEAARWLAPDVGLRAGIPSSPQLASVPAGLRYFPDAGVLVWTAGQARLFFRCPIWFRHRPAQADLLHVDLTWRGQMIAHDAGTFSYNTSGPFAGGLKEASVHNTLTIDGAEPLQKVSRFLYLPWPRGEAGWNSASESFAATHSGWRMLGLRHERRIRAAALSGEEGWEVLDRVQGAGEHRGRLHWLLADVPHAFDAMERRMVLQTTAGAYAVSWEKGNATLVRAAADSNRGWWSPYYDQALPALSLAIEFEFTGSVDIITTFAPVPTAGN